MSKAIKSLSFLCALIMAITVFASCTSAPGNSAPAAPAQDGAAGTPQSSDSGGGSDKKVTLQVVVPFNEQEFPAGVTEDDNFIVNYWREKTGFDFDIIVMPKMASENESEEKLNIMFSSGEITGLAFSRRSEKAGLLASQGMLANLDDYIANCELVKRFPDEQILCRYDGSQYGIAIPSDGIKSQGAAVYVRKDVMDANNMGAPATFEDLTKMLEMFKSQGMIAAVGGKPSSKTFDLFLSMFGISSTSQEAFCVRDGNIAFKAIMPQAKDYLSYMGKLYADGIIPADFASLNPENVNELYLSGKAGIAVNEVCWSAANLIPQSESLGFDTRFLDYPTNYKGETAYGDTYNAAAALVAVISKSCNYIPEAIEFLNFLLEPETLMVNNFGIEGEHYTMENGIPTATDKSTEIAWAVYYRNVFMPDDWYPVYGVGAKWAEYYYPTERHTVGNTDTDPTHFLPKSPEMEMKRKELTDSIVDPFFTAVITGQKSVDEFDAYVAEWLSSGGQEILDFYTQLYKDNGSPKFTNRTFLPENHPDYTGKYLFDGKE